MKKETIKFSVSSKYLGVDESYADVYVVINLVKDILLLEKPKVKLRP